jgi:hypothetical protein
MRAKFQTRTLLLRNESVRNNLLALVRNLPLDDAYPLEVVIREQIKGRKLDQNALYWIRLGEISAQAWVEGKQFSAEVWAGYFKKELLPEVFDPDMCREGYEKWQIDPSGDRVLIGSTTQLTVKGFAEYLEAVTAFGASYGVLFTASPNER